MSSLRQLAVANRYAARSHVLLGKSCQNVQFPAKRAVWKDVCFRGLASGAGRQRLGA